MHACPHMMVCECHNNPPQPFLVISGTGRHLTVGGGKCFFPPRRKSSQKRKGIRVSDHRTGIIKVGG